MANKIAELGGSSQRDATPNFDFAKPQYRDRARERRQLYGLDPGDATAETTSRLLTCRQL